MMMEKLPYKCKEVLELYGSRDEEIGQIEKLHKSFTRLDIHSEIYYSNKGDLSYATLVVFLPWTFHAELSKFDAKVFKMWHGKKIDK